MRRRFIINIDKLITTSQVCICVTDKLSRPQSFPTADSLKLERRKHYATDTEIYVLRKRTKSFPPLGMLSGNMLSGDELGRNYVNMQLSNIDDGNDGGRLSTKGTVNFTLYSTDDQSDSVVPITIDFPGSKQEQNRKRGTLSSGSSGHRRKRHSGDYSDSQESNDEDEGSSVHQIKPEKAQDGRKSLEELLESHSAASPEMTDLVNYMSDCATNPSMHQDSAVDRRWGLKVKMEVDSFRMSASSLVSDENDNSPLTACRHELHDGKASEIGDSTESCDDWVVYSTPTTTTSMSAASWTAGTSGVEREPDVVESGEEGLVYTCTGKSPPPHEHCRQL